MFEGSILDDLDYIVVEPEILESTEDNDSNSDDNDIDSSDDIDSDCCDNNSNIVTENGAPSLSTTTDPRVDLFYKTIRRVSDENLVPLLEASWKLYPLDTLKIIFFVRDIRGKGKGERKVFHQCIRWLIKNHPNAVKRNLKHIPFYGCYKDWLEVFLGSKYESEMLSQLVKQLNQDYSDVQEFLNNDDLDADTDIDNNGSGFFSFLWFTPPEDNKSVIPRPRPNISLAWKWTPSEKSHYDKDKYKGTVNKICSRMYVNKKEYRKMSTLMRSHLDIVEGLMCGKKWEEIDFSKVPSRAMNMYKEAFKKHEPERFGQYLADVKVGKSKMNTGTLQPHEIVGQYLKHGSQQAKMDIEVMWASFLDNIRKKGVSFDHTVSVIDVSGSMLWEGAMPLKVAISLGLVVSELCSGPFHKKWITFSSDAKLNRIEGETLYDQVKSISKGGWGLNTNLQSVFELILNTYSLFNVLPENQIKRLFIFTDGQWDKMVNGGDKTNFDAIDEKYKWNGYERPHLIFWNIRANTIDFPTLSDVDKVSLVSGFSSDLLQLFLDEGEINPLALVLRAIHDERYDRISL
jgi:hypothetical protein